MIDAKKQGFAKGDKWTSEYLFHIPTKRAKRKKSKQEEMEDLENKDDSDQHDEPIVTGATGLAWLSPPCDTYPD